jgi:hypothetical protein
MIHMPFSKMELELVNNRLFFETKASVMAKVFDLLNEMSVVLERLIKEHQNIIPDGALSSSPKISRGENYQGFPWMVLDYPRLFSSQQTFAFRTLFWWGHSWIFTFQLSGDCWRQFALVLWEQLPHLANNDYRIACGLNPWIHDPDDSSFLPVSEEIFRNAALMKKLRDQPYFKMAAKWPFEQSDLLECKALEFYNRCLRLLSVTNQSDV